MAPRIKVTRVEIINEGLDLIRRNGEYGLNARELSRVLNCSTQPIFSNFHNMDELADEIRAAAYDIYLGFLKNEATGGKYPRYKAFGMAYIRFAKEEKELFKLLFMCDRYGKAPSFTVDYTESVEMIMKMNEVSREQAELIHLEMWATVHGIATMLATSFLDFEWELISNMLSDIYHGLRAKHLSETK